MVNGHRPAAITTNGSAAATSVHPAGNENSCPFSSCRQTRSSPQFWREATNSKVASGQRVEWVHHPDAPVPIVEIGCS